MVVSDASLPDLLTEATTYLSWLSLNQTKRLEQLEGLRKRLENERFQLAVLGQFKRGKSTLLNALLGVEVLPTAVVPLTAIPTFLEAGSELHVRVTHDAGVQEHNWVLSFDSLRGQLKKLVTEEGNPKNVLRIARVEVSLPSALLQSGVVLIDTPGVGSTFQHNTETAEAVLPECDAALFVVSPDPPITAVEIEYLAQIKQTVVQIIVVLNKIDAFGPEERTQAVQFIRRTLAEQVGLSSMPVFCVSARNALKAKLADNQAALKDSGLNDLEDSLLEFIARKKRATLSTAIARKAAAIVRDLLFEANLVLQALTMPIEDLERRGATFREALDQFETERRTAHDLLAGDQKRAHEALGYDAQRLRNTLFHQLQAEMHRLIDNWEGADPIWKAISGMLPSRFEAEYRQVLENTRARLEENLSVHQQRADELIGLVRQTAAELMDVPFHAPESEEAFEARTVPYWVTSRAETLNPIPPGALDWLLPAGMRKARIRRRLLGEIERAVLRNIENLRWATRQNIDDAFRRFGAELDERLAASIAATRNAIEQAKARRDQHADTIAAEVEHRRELAARLDKIARSLEALGSAESQALSA